MESKTWLAILLSLAVWLGWMTWFAPPPPAGVSRDAVQEGTPNSASNSSTAPIADSSNEWFKKTLKTGGFSSLKNDRLLVALSDAGGRVSKVELSDYHESIDPKSDFIKTVDTAASSFELATLFSDTDLKGLSDSTYEREQSAEGIRFSRVTQDGVKIEKYYSLPRDGYAIDAKFKIIFPSGSKRDWGNLIIPVGGSSLQHDKNLPLKTWEVVAYQNDSVTRKHIEQLKKEELVLQGHTDWLAFGNKYFSTAVINHSSINPDVVLINDAAFSGGYLRFPLQLKSDQNELSFSFQVYSGPKDVKSLSQFKGLKQLIDYGFFSYFAYPLLQVLKFFYGFVKNYGAAIILLTILVRLIFYPLTYQGYRSARNMQKLQPQIVALKEKYKDDKEKLNREQLALFKTHKVNPLGGCLPMLVQLPIFMALYAVLGNSIELFHAPFFLWVHDLSSRDTFYVFPVLMGITLLIQQKLTPTAGMDPAQAKMMYIMPFVLTFVMINLPSGLTVYMFVSTLLGILQQLAMMKDRKKTAALVPVVKG
jgi:YidC/Oxa1 family membrane protein insertase